MSVCWLFLGPICEVEIVLKHLTLGFYFLKRRHFFLLKIQTLLYFGISIHWVFVSLLSKAMGRRRGKTIVC